MTGILLKSLHFLFSRQGKSTMKWAAWGPWWWSQLTITSFSVCWLVTGILSCIGNSIASWIGSDVGPRRCYKGSDWIHTCPPWGNPLLSLYISFLHFPFHDGAAEKCCQIGLSSVKWGPGTCFHLEGKDCFLSNPEFQHLTSAWWLCALKISWWIIFEVPPSCSI